MIDPALMLNHCGRCDRARLVRVALSSALTSVGSRTDQCSEWRDKLAEVRAYLLARLPLEKAAELYELFLTHANCRRKKSFHKDSDEDTYARLLEFEEALLMQVNINMTCAQENKNNIPLTRALNG